MLKSLLITWCCAFATTTAFATDHSALSKRAVVIPRPQVWAHPHAPAKPHLVSPARTKTCAVKALGGTSNDAPNILAAAQSCNHGGTVQLLDASYNIGSPLDLRFLSAVDIVIGGTIKFTNDITYWVKNSFKFDYQNSSAFWLIGGSDVNVYGDGKGKAVIDGNGQAWYDRFASDATLLRPILFNVESLTGGSVSGLKLKNGPTWFFLVANSTDVIFDGINITVSSSSSNPAKNTDGWDTYRSSAITIQNSNIQNGDDCVSFKPNSTDIVVQNLACTGSHGISVGSLGQYPNAVDIVENIYVANISMSNASDGARIKVWPGIDSKFQPSLNGGGGSGRVKNITFAGMKNTNNDYAIEVTGCYGQKNLTLCQQYPSKITIEDVLFKDFTGTTSKKYDPIVGTLVCGSTASCKNIVAQNIKVTPPSKKTAKWTCSNLDKSLLAINCL